MKIIEGDICDAKEQYILHQCNCVTNSARGVAKVIFDKYPDANTYINRTKSIPGTIDVIKSNDKTIINAYAQYYPGSSKYNNDTKELRLKWFEKCIDEIINMNISEIAIPYNIGCGYAGGNFDDYMKLLLKLDEKVNVILCKLIF